MTTLFQKSLSAILVYLCVVFCIVPTNGFAKIAWKTTFLQKAADLTSNEVRLEFPFHNEGRTPVRILSAVSSCSCTMVDLKKSTYAPGESGVLSATFLIDDRSGIQNRSILVETDESPDKTQQLNFRILIPQIAKVTPDHLVWRLGGAPTTQTMTLLVKQEAPVGILEARSSNPNFKVEVKTVLKGFRYQILVTPAGLSSPMRSVISIRTDFPPVRPRTYIRAIEVSPSG